MFFLEPSLLVGRLFVPVVLDPGFGLDKDIVWSSPTVPQRASTLPFCLSVPLQRGRNLRVEILGGGEEGR
jgi:hypothetical protein